MSQEPRALELGSTKDGGSYYERLMEGGYKGRRAQYYEGQRLEGESVGKK